MLGKAEILKSKILIVDDDDDDVFLAKEILTQAGYRNVDATLAPEEAAPLHAKNNYGLIMLDLRMPKMSGFEVMEKLREVETMGYLPLLVVTGMPTEKIRALKLGAKDFIAKPYEASELRMRVYNMLEMRLLHQEMQQYKDILEEKVRQRTAEIKQSHLETIVAMTRAAEYKDEDTGDHLERIGFYCKELATLLGADAVFTDTIFFASPMHDIGKIGIPDNILLKPGSLNPQEWEIMKGHTGLGAKILENCKAPYLRTGAEIAMNHHERWDGGGYPNKLAKTAIPLSARIMNICDIYDALRSKRPYKPPFTHAKTFDIITKGDGRTMPSHFDPAILEAFRSNGKKFEEVFEEFRQK